jgi:hypothetical protein
MNFSARNPIIHFSVILLAAGVLFPASGRAVPSFARQTGMSCSVCHTVFPELTSFGRTFKMTGYTLGSVKKISETTSETTGETTTRLQINETVPVGVMMMLSHSMVAAQDDTFTVQAGSDGKGSIQFPAQFSLFYAGALSPKLGTFVQLTYDPGAGFLHFDNTDVRYADKFSLMDTELLWGVDLNNNPTVQDVWNTVPAWGFPFATSDLTKGPLAAARIDQSLAQQVASVGAYAFWNNLLYVEGSVYRSVPQGPVAPGSDVIQDFAPYWRVALQQDWDKHSAEVGAFGLVERKLSTAAVKNDPADQFTDYALDAQYQYNGDEHIVTAQAIWINEFQMYNGLGVVPDETAFNATDTLQTLRLAGTYYWHRTFGGTLGWFATSGSADPGLYPAAPVTGSASNTPDENGVVAELNYMPWLNTKFSLQYTWFNQYAGATTNYDGSGRNAADNDTTMLMAWLMY